MTRLEIPALVLGTLSIAAGLHAQDDTKHLLRYQLKKGTVVHYQLTKQQEMKMNVRGQPMDTNMSMDLFLELSVLDDAGGNFQIEQRLYRIKMKMKNAMMGDIEFDTDDEDSVPTMFDTMLDMVDKRIKATIDPRGRIVEQVIPEEMKGQAAERTGIDLDNMFSELLVEYPEEPVAVGATWSTNRKQSMGRLGDIEIDEVNELVSVEGPNATIRQNIDMSFGEGLPMEAEVENARSKLVVDARTGLAESMTMSVEMNTKISQGGMEMDMQQSISGSMKRIEPPKQKAEATAGKDGKADK